MDTEKDKTRLETLHCHEKYRRVADKPCSTRPYWQKFTNMVKDLITTDRVTFWRNYIEPLIQQGNLLKLIMAENADLTWKSIIYDLPRGVLRHGSQIRPQLSVASPTNWPQPKVIKTTVIIKLKLWPAAGCEAKAAAELSYHA